MYTLYFFNVVKKQEKKLTVFERLQKTITRHEFFFFDSQRPRFDKSNVNNNFVKNE
jgi:hypothetical protein